MWEYQIVKADSSETFLSSLNNLGHAGWEAISGSYGIGESKKVSLGHGMPVSTLAGIPMWVAVMKRTVNDRAPQ
jgi:hypothetical protein